MKYQLNHSNQRGMALVVGLILLAAATIITVAGMQGMQMQERMTSGQNNKAIALNAAEAGASRFARGAMDNGAPWWADDDWMAVIPADGQQQNNFGAFGYFWIDPNDVVGDGDSVTVTVRGLAREGTQILAETHLNLELSATLGQPSGGDSFNPFADAGVIGCEGVTTRGSGRIDSYDSRVAAYDRNNPGYQGHVRTTSAGAQVELLGNAPIYGNVNSTGGVRATGSSPTHGNINATGLVELQGNVDVFGNITTAGDVVFQSSGTAHQNVSANGDVIFNNWSASVHGDVTAGGSVTSNTNRPSPLDHIGGSTQSGGNPNNPGVALTECDPLEIDNVMAGVAGLASTGDMDISPWRYRDVRLGPAGVQYYDPHHTVGAWVEDDTRVMETVELFGQSATVLKVDDFNLGSNGSLVVEGGDVVLVVDGDMDIGGNTSITIEPGSSLTVLLTGKFHLQGSVDVHDGDPIDSDGRLPFSLFSSYEQMSAQGTNDGIRLRGNTDLTGVIYAPKAHVSMGGSGDLFGQVRGKTVEAFGAGGVHYDVALGDFTVGDPSNNAGEDNGDPTFSITRWNVVLD